MIQPDDRQHCLSDSFNFNPWIPKTKPMLIVISNYFFFNIVLVIRKCRGEKRSHTQAFAFIILVQKYDMIVSCIALAVRHIQWDSNR